MAQGLLPSLLLIAALAAPAARAGEVMIDFPGTEVGETTLAYRCGSTGIDVRYVNAGPVSLAIFDWEGERIVASAGIAASGVRYVGGRYVWWSKGSEATLLDEMADDGDAPLASCIEQP
ncbi:MAG: MliC family protein [Aliihoeflea sp.]|uniref:MliC family protein n=1 Tax=Aliihoeflea sp. TaxID=2608088 RepID=UPI0040332D67